MTWMLWRHQYLAVLQQLVAAVKKSDALVFCGCVLQPGVHGLDGRRVSAGPLERGAGVAAISPRQQRQHDELRLWQLRFQQLDGLLQPVQMRQKLVEAVQSGRCLPTE